MAKSKAVVKANTQGKQDVISDIPRAEALQRLGALKGADRVCQFFVYYFNNLAVKQCAALCDYKLGTAYALLKRYQREPKLRERVHAFLGTAPDEFRVVGQARLHKVASIHGKVLDLFEANPQLAAEKPTILKQVMQVAGVLHDDAPSVQHVDIQSIKVLVGQMVPDLARRPALTVDAGNDDD